MGANEKTRETVESILAELHAKIDTLKERVEKLCETTDCLGTIEQNAGSTKKKNVKN
jgi:hypothetical protein